MADPYYPNLDAMYGPGWEKKLLEMQAGPDAQLIRQAAAAAKPGAVADRGAAVVASPMSAAPELTAPPRPAQPAAVEAATMPRTAAAARPDWYEAVLSRGMAKDGPAAPQAEPVLPAAAPAGFQFDKTRDPGGRMLSAAVDRAKGSGNVLPGAPEGATWTAVTQNQRGGYLSDAFADDYRQNPDGTYTHLGRRQIGTGDVPPEAYAPKNPYEGLAPTLDPQQARLRELASQQGSAAALQKQAIDAQAEQNRLRESGQTERQRMAVDAERQQRMFPYTPEGMRADAGRAAVAAQLQADPQTPPDQLEAILRQYGTGPGGPSNPPSGTAPPVADPVRALMSQIRPLIPQPEGRDVQSFGTADAEKLLDVMGGTSLTPAQVDDLVGRMLRPGTGGNGVTLPPVVSNVQSLRDAAVRSAVQAGVNLNPIPSERVGDLAPFPIDVGGTQMLLEKPPSETDFGRNATQIRDGFRYWSMGFDPGAIYRQARVGDRVIPLSAGDLSRSYWSLTPADRQRYEQRLKAAGPLIERLNRLRQQTPQLPQ